MYLLCSTNWPSLGRESINDSHTADATRSERRDGSGNGHRWSRRCDRHFNEQDFDLWRRVFDVRWFGPGNRPRTGRGSRVTGESKGATHETKQFCFACTAHAAGRARKAAESEGMALNETDHARIAEKVSAMRTEESTLRNATTCLIRQGSTGLQPRVGKGNPPAEGDRTPIGVSCSEVKEKEVRSQTSSVWNNFGIFEGEIRPPSSPLKRRLENEKDLWI